MYAAENRERPFTKEEISNICREGLPKVWSKAADLSSQLNIRYVENYFGTVLSISPKMYDDIWTGGKCMYKLESVVANRGRLHTCTLNTRKGHRIHFRFSPNNTRMVRLHSLDYNENVEFSLSDTSSKTGHWSDYEVAKK